MSELTAGTLSFADFEAFNSLMDTFDMLNTYNIDKDDPLAGTYDDGAVAVGTGEAAFWFMGNWAWPQIDEVRGDSEEFGFLPVPLDMEGEVNKISAGPTKYVAIDASQSSDAQQEAALTFLNWLIYEEAGQNALVNTCSVIPAFTNIEISPEDPLAASIKDYIAKDAFYSMVLTFPSDYWAEVGAYFQEYLAGYASREDFYSKMEDYWAKQ
jgi:raffinose/stachyose/melibiose transport system substrate-binding protein